VVGVSSPAQEASPPSDIVSGQDEEVDKPQAAPMATTFRRTSAPGKKQAEGLEEEVEQGADLWATAAILSPRGGVKEFEEAEEDFEDAEEPEAAPIVHAPAPTTQQPVPTPAAPAPKQQRRAQVVKPQASLGADHRFVMERVFHESDGTQGQQRRGSLPIAPAAGVRKDRQQVLKPQASLPLDQHTVMHRVFQERKEVVQLQLQKQGPAPRPMPQQASPRVDPSAFRRVSQGLVSTLNRQLYQC
jgi:hypothetical protein